MEPASDVPLQCATSITVSSDDATRFHTCLSTREKILVLTLYANMKHDFPLEEISFEKSVKRWSIKKYFLRNHKVFKLHFLASWVHDLDGMRGAIVSNKKIAGWIVA